MNEKHTKDHATSVTTGDITATQNSQLTIIGEQYNHAPPIGCNFSDYVDKEVKALQQALQEEGQNLFHYQSQSVSFEGRADELALLEKFLADDCKIRIISVTGIGGSGKSKLVYEFARKHSTSSVWAFVRLDWSHFRTDVLGNAPVIYGYPKQLVLILDYVLADAKEIGQWISRLETHYKTQFQHNLRIIILEREIYDPTLERTPLWYD